MQFRSAERATHLISVADCPPSSRSSIPSQHTTDTAASHWIRLRIGAKKRGYRAEYKRLRSRLLFSEVSGISAMFHSEGADPKELTSVYFDLRELADAFHIPFHCNYSPLDNRMDSKPSDRPTNPAITAALKQRIYIPPSRPGGPLDE